METQTQCISICPISLPSCSYSRSIPVHKHLRLFQRRKPFLSLSHSQNHSPLNHFYIPTLPSPSTKNQTHDDADSDQKLFHQFYLSINSEKSPDQNPDTQNHKQDLEEENQKKNPKKKKGFFTNMWWVKLKAALGQRLNVEGIVSSVSVVAKDRHLALPHVFVPDVRHIDWGELQKRGFKGVVFDKDNTITAPYCLTLWAPLNSSIEQCKSVFGHDIAVFSNSAGLCEYDHDGSKAKALERSIGIKVIRHRVKKPAGTAEEIEKHFGCTSSQLIMVGDRPFTDVVFGNRNGFLTILTEPLSIAGETFIVRQVRKLETFLMNCWLKKGMKPISHCLLPDTKQCVKDP